MMYIKCKLFEHNILGHFLVKVLCNFVKLKFCYFEFIKDLCVILRVFIIESMTTDVIDFIYLTRKFIWT